MPYNTSLFREAYVVASSVVYLHTPPAEVLESEQKLDAWKNTIAKRYRRRELSFAKRNVLLDSTHDCAIRSDEDAIIAHISVETALTSLTDLQKEVIIKYYLEEHTVSEIAEELSISKSNVKDRMRYVIKKLRDIFEAPPTRSVPKPKVTKRNI